MFFSAHGVPKSYVEEAGDPYKEEMEECVALIMTELRRRGRCGMTLLSVVCCVLVFTCCVCTCGWGLGAGGGCVLSMSVL